MQYYNARVNKLKVASRLIFLESNYENTNPSLCVCLFSLKLSENGINKKSNKRTNLLD